MGTSSSLSNHWKMAFFTATLFFFTTNAPVFASLLLETITIDAKNQQLVFQLPKGQGFDPELSTEKLSDGHYLLHIQGDGLLASKMLIANRPMLSSKVKATFNGVESINWLGLNQNKKLDIRLLSKKPYSLQVRSNKPGEVRIALVPQSITNTGPSTNKLPKTPATTSLNANSAPTLPTSSKESGHFLLTPGNLTQSEVKLALEAVEKNNPQKAFELLQTLEHNAKEPLSPAINWLYLQTAFQTSHWQEANSALNRLNLPLGETCYWKGLLAEAKGQWQEALNLYQEAINQAPSLTNARFRLAMVALSHNQQALAKTQLAQLLLQEPDNPEAHKAMAYLAHLEGDIETAKTSYQNALQADALYNLAVLEKQGGQLAEATALAQAARLLANDNPELLLNIGLLLSDLGQKDKSVSSLEASLNFKGPPNTALSQQSREKALAALNALKTR